MAGREVREYTNLTDPKDKKSGKGKDKIDDEDITYHVEAGKTLMDLDFYWAAVDMSRCKKLLVSVADIFMDVEVGVECRSTGEKGDDLLYLKEQMEAEEDAERLLRRTEKRAFAAFRKAASLADSLPASIPLPLRVEQKTKSGIRQQGLLKKVVEIKPKRQRVSSPVQTNPTTSVSNEDEKASRTSSLSQPALSPRVSVSQHSWSEASQERNISLLDDNKPVKSLLGIAYGSSDDED